jgi:hypothetical protein
LKSGFRGVRQKREPTEPPLILRLKMAIFVPMQKLSAKGDNDNRLPIITFFGLTLMMMIMAGCAAQKSSANHFKFGQVIPTGKITVEVLEIRFSKRTEELALQMNSAVATNQDWWMEYIKQHHDDYPLPYHTNIGLTQAEYAEYLDGANRTRHLHKVSDAYIIFGRQGDLISIDLGDENSPVAKWRLNALTGELLLPIGKSVKPVWVSGDDLTQPIGAFEGYRWNYESPSEAPSNRNIASLDIYRQKPSGMIFWRIKEGKIEDSHCVRSLDSSFRYDPKCVEH